MKPNQTNKTTVFGYVRVSTDNQIENYSIEEQIERLKAFCLAKDWILLKIYTDGGFSGGNTNRPALQQLLQEVKNHAVNAVLVYKLDRLSRSQKDTITLIEDEFLPNGVDFISINENFDTSTPFGRAMIGILSVFAQLEKDQITERFTMGRIARGKAGYYHGGSIFPLGYNYISSELVVDEYKSLQVAEIYDSFLNGKSINAIWHDMANKYGGKWSAPKIRLILLNDVYIGKVKFAGVSYDGVHMPIISKEKFEEVQKLLVSEERENKKRASQKTPFRAGFLLSSLIVCGRCGARYSANHGYYKCYSRSKSSQKFIADPNCYNDNWLIETLDNLIINSIHDLIVNRALLNSVLETGNNSVRIIDTQGISNRIKEIDTQINRMVDLFQVGTISMDVISARMEDLNSQRNRLMVELSKAEEVKVPVAEAFISSLKDFQKNFDTSDFSKQRLIVSSLIQQIQVDGNDIKISWRI